MNDAFIQWWKESGMTERIDEQQPSRFDVARETWESAWSAATDTERQRCFRIVDDESNRSLGSTMGDWLSQKLNRLAMAIHKGF